MAENVFLQYVIHLTDRAQVELLQGQPHDGGAVGSVIKAPDQAAIDYAAPVIALPGGVFTPPAITSEWFGTRDNFPTDQKSFERCEGGWFGICFLFGNKKKFYWRGLFEYSPPLDGDPGVGNGGTPDPVATRRWIDGFETPDLSAGGGEGGAGTSTAARTASRHIDGYGLAIRNSTSVRTHRCDDHTAGLTPTTSWERFYLRGRVWPDGQKVLWRSRTQQSSNVGLLLMVTPSGQLGLFQSDSASGFTLLGTAQALDLHTWYRVDILFKFGPGAAVYLSVNGTRKLTVTGLGAEIAINPRTHASSEMGSSVAANEAIDVDDWICADWPFSAPTMVTPGLDWQNGSKVAWVSPTGYGAGNVWTGDHAVLRQRPLVSTAQMTARTNAVSGAVLEVDTDAALSADAVPNSIGAVALVVGLYSLRGSALSGTLGYTLPGGAPVMTAITQGAAAAWNTVLYHPIGLTEPFLLGGLQLRHAKAADVGASSVYVLQAAAEVLGAYGLEDVYPGDTIIHTFVSNTGIHNAPYPRSPWATSLTPPLSPYEVVAGSYVGDAAGITLTFRSPVTFFWCRRVTTLGEGIRWWTSMNAAQRGVFDTPQPDGMITAEVDPTFVPVQAEDAQEQQYRLRITGAHLQANNPGDTYTYLAICDPGMRFLVAGALGQHKGATDRTHALQHPTFLPDCGFFAHQVSNGSFSTVGIFYKGPGHAAATLSPMGSTELANAMSWVAGTLTSKSAFHNVSAQQIPFCLMRKDDLSGDPGVVKVLQLASYTGDGSASRSVSLAPATGLRPLFAIVQPHNASAIMRDSSHTGTTSMVLNAVAANASTGITGGGPDQLSVGSVLNANGIVYDVFVIPGSATAGNGGFSPPGVFNPVPPAVPGDGPWTPGPIDPDAPAEPEPPAPESPEPTTPWPTGCTAATTQLVNVALSRIGITKQVVDVSVEQRPEAATARLLYALALESTLRAYPWPFATQYAYLTLLGGTDTVPISPDWLYAYRLPADFVFARRLVLPLTTGKARTYEEQPLPFKVSTDETGTVTGSSEGGLLYTDAAPGTFALEYTRRATCPAASSDPLFKSAFAWRLGAEMAPGLSRDEKKTEFCLVMFERTIALAQIAASNEQQQEIQRPDAPWIDGRD